MRLGDEQWRSDRVRQFLMTIGERDVRQVRSVPHGHWCRAFTYICADGQRVIRFSATNEDFLKDEWVGAHLSETLPVPKVFRIGPTLDGFYAISQRMFGRYLDEMTESQLL